jgi:hypothetical protein
MEKWQQVDISEARRTVGGAEGYWLAYTEAVQEITFRFQVGHKAKQRREEIKRN